MTAWLIASIWLQTAACTPAAAGLLTTATQHARLLRLADAADSAAAAGRAGCTEGLVEAWYLRGLIAAHDAYRDGGSPASLAPVQQAVAALEQLAGGAPGPAEIGRVTLLAAMAAAQSERDEMAVFLDFALRMESLQLSAGQPGAPGVSAHEAAGDLWLQVHRYEDAARAYEQAGRVSGRTPRVLLGLARVAVRMELPGVACRQYRALDSALRSSGAAPGTDATVAAEMRRYLAGPACAPPQTSPAPSLAPAAPTTPQP